MTLIPKRKVPERIRAIWPRPRVGDHIRLKNGKVVEVITIQAARDVLKSKTEMEAELMGPQLRAIYGDWWIEVYYEAMVADLNGYNVGIVNPQDVSCIEDTS